MFLLWFLQSLLALLWLLLIPTDSGAYSFSRLLLLGLLVIPAIFFAVLSFNTRIVSWDSFFSRPWLYNFLYLVAVILFLLPPALIIILRALGQTIGIIYTAYAERLAPLAFLASAMGVEWCVWHILVLKKSLAHVSSILAPALKILLLFVVIVMLVFYTRWGIAPSRDGSFGNPPTPLLEWQIVLAVVIGATAMLTESHWKLKRLDVFLFLLIYLLTCFLWLSDPLIPGSFATPPRAPNFEPYPFSDPLIYAQYSQSALVGGGFQWPDVPTRPLYVMLLTWMYASVGQSYAHIIFMQTLLLAIFPAALYLLGSELGSRPAGLMLGLLAAFRDVTTNHAAPFASNYSYSKLLLSEMPAALFLVIFTILTIKWIKAPKQNWYFLVIGAVLGLATLIRLQSAVLLAPMAFMTIFPLLRSRRFEWLRGVILIALGVMLTFSPWLVRNYLATGGLVVDNPISQSMTFARRWSGDNGNTIFPQFSDETTAQYVSRMNGIAVESFKREPARILNAAANHFFNNLIDSLHTFPIRDRLESPRELLWPTYAFWQTGARSPLLSMFYLVLLAFGLATAWTTHRWAGLLPFIFSLGYNLWTAIFLSSGDRFLLPIDWTWHLYYVLGLLLLSKIALSGMQNIQWISATQADTNCIVSKPARWQVTVLTAVLVLCVGMSLPLTELVFPEKYPALTQAQLSTKLGIIPMKGEMILYGRAIYPRYYKSGDGEPATAKLGYGPEADARLVFWLVGPKAGLVIFPLETDPKFFPHASDVWVIGTLDANAIQARIIKVETNGKSVVYGQ